MLNSKPKHKILLFLFFFTLLVLSPLKFTPLFFIFLFFLCFFFKINIKNIFSKPILFLLLLQFLFHFFFHFQEPLALRIFYGLAAVSYFLSILFLLKLFFYFMPLNQIKTGLIELGLSEKLSTMFSIVFLSFIFLKKKIFKIYLLQKIRGSRSIFSLLIPIFNLLIPKAKVLSRSMIIRGFDI